MKYGIYYAYWEKSWGGDFIPYVDKVKKLGFDILEVAAAGLADAADDYALRLKDAAQKNGITLTAGLGPSAEINLSNPKTFGAGQEYYRRLFPKMKRAGIGFLGGALYSYWPVDYSRPFDKQADRACAVKGMQWLGELAAEYGISLGMEVLNRFETYILTSAREALDFVREVGRDNVGIMLDTFHMNIEEDSFVSAIRCAGKYLNHLHVGEANRKPPREGRMPWKEIGQALRDIGFDGNVVMEPFILMGGQVGSDIKVWRDISEGATPRELDLMAAESVSFLRKAFEPDKK